MDNVLLAHEMVHTLQSLRKAGMIIQLDLSKACDKVSWNYLEAVLVAFGFSPRWITWILAMVKSPSYSILVNGAPSEPFLPSRGIQKGDPISPFLFLILMEGLNRLIKSAKDKNIIKGLQPLNNIPTTTHQQFFDDTMLHGMPTVKEAKGFKYILNLFSLASGMDLNLEKYSILFFNTHFSIQKHLIDILGVKRCNLLSKYLGIPLTDKP